jgi:hypothetical protein
VNHSFKSILILPSLALLIGIGVYFNGSETSLHASKHCDLDDTLICRFNLVNDKAQELNVKFINKVQIEEQNEIFVTLPVDSVIEKIWIQGVNMYMGKIAVFEQATKQDTEDKISNMQFFLGSCSEEKMRWQLVIVIKKASGQSVTRKSETYFINFKTDIS